MDKFDSILSSVIDSHLGLRSRLIGYQYSEIIRAVFCSDSSPCLPSGSERQGSTNSTSTPISHTNLFGNTDKTTSFADALASVNAKKVNEWKRFLEIAQEQKNTRNGDKGVQIFLDSEVKKTLEKLKLAGLDYPVRYLLNAAVKTFLEANSERVREQLSNL